MRVSYFISRNIRYTKANSFSATAVKVATATVALGIAVIILAISVLEGFRYEIKNRLFGLANHITISKYSDNPYDLPPIEQLTTLNEKLKKNKFVRNSRVFAFKGALLKTQESIHGIVVKGYEPEEANLKQSAFKGIILLKGRYPKTPPADSLPEELLISSKQAKLLNLNVDSAAVLFFLQDPPKFRKVKICGIYSAGVEEYEESVAISTLSTLQSVNNWPKDVGNGIEVLFTNIDSTTTYADKIKGEIGVELKTKTAEEQFPYLFEWLTMIGRNVDILTVLIITVACFNMISTLLIMLFERSAMIGLLKTLGANNKTIQEIFLWSGIRIIGLGLVFGNAIGLGLGAIQYFFKPITLDSENYYVEFVPILWDWSGFLFANLLVIGICSASLLLPLLIIRKIKPVAALRFK